jgi:hypothetical protein
MSCHLAARRRPLQGRDLRARKQEEPKQRLLRGQRERAIRDAVIRLLCATDAPSWLKGPGVGSAVQFSPSSDQPKPAPQPLLAQGELAGARGEGSGLAVQKPQYPAAPPRGTTVTVSQRPGLEYRDGSTWKTLPPWRFESGATGVQFTRSRLVAKKVAWQTPAPQLYC